MPNGIHHREAVVTPRQRIAFLAMQMVLCAATLWISAKLLRTLLSGLVGHEATTIAVVACCASVILWRSLYVVRTLSMKRAVLLESRVPSGLRIAMATTIVPSREFDLLRAKLEGMVGVDPCGNALEHWVLDEEDEPRVRDMIDEFNRLHPNAHIRHFTRKNNPRYNEAPRGRRYRRFQARQKGGNINAWLDSIPLEDYDVVTFLDLDHVPRSDFYRRVLPYFRDAETCFVQGPESFCNRENNFITRAASFERDVFFGLLHRGYFGLGIPVIVGSHTTFRSEALRSLGGAYPVHLTEDYLIMMHLHSLKKQGVYLDEVLAVGQLPSTWDAYLGQQLRWSSGGLDLLFRYFPPLISSYGWRHGLFLFVLLNYYAWGAFFVLAKTLLLGGVLAGLALHAEAGLIASIVGLTVVSALANHLWERQFFVERGRRTFFAENALMNNFLGGLYCLAMFKSLVTPNSPFRVTTKNRPTADRAVDTSGYRILASCMIAIELAGLATVWIRSVGTNVPSLAWSGHNLLLYPLILSVAGNALVLILFRRLEREQVRTRPIPYSRRVPAYR
jgi:cellulose synthase/poly-beta-1,6-N-acetylglucosamine synthase-like glycosyltransferase